MIQVSERNSGTRRSTGALIKILIAALVVIATALGIWFLIGAIPVSSDQKVSVPQLEQIQASWEAKEYETCEELASKFLDAHPLDFQALLYRGFSRYYLGEGQVAIETRNQILVSAIADLRLAAILEPHRNNADIQYILGKSYYSLGYFYMDLADLYLRMALKSGFRSTDLLEYLGVISSNLGDVPRAIEFFNQALGEENREAVHLALAAAYLSLEDYGNVLKHVESIMAIKKDPEIALRARFIKADVLARTDKIDEALAEYLTILADDPNSADGHFYVGEMYFAKGDSIKARAEWRAAANLDPKHNGAINRLNTGM